MLSSNKYRTLLLVGLALASCKKGDISIPQPIKEAADASPEIPEPVEDNLAPETKALETVVEAKTPEAATVIPQPEPIVTKTDPVPTPTPVEPVLLLSVEPGLYLLKSQGSGRCLDVPYASPEVGMQLQIYDCGNNATASQVFMIQHVGDNYFSITNPSNKLSLEVQGGAMAPTTAVQQALYTGKSYQQFSFHKNSDGTFVIKTRTGDFAVDVVAAGLSNGTRIQIWPPNNYTNENWTLKTP